MPSRHVREALRKGGLLDDFGQPTERAIDILPPLPRARNYPVPAKAAATSRYRPPTGQVQYGDIIIPSPWPQVPRKRPHSGASSADYRDINDGRSWWQYATSMAGIDWSAAARVGLSTISPVGWGPLATLDAFTASRRVSRPTVRVFGGGWTFSHECWWSEGGGPFQPVSADRWTGDADAHSPGQCVGLQAKVGFPLSTPVTAPTADRRLNIWNDYFPAGALRQRTQSYWTRPASGPPAWIRQYGVYFHVNTHSIAHHALDPARLPVLAQVPVPLPLPVALLPYRQPNPWRAEQSEWGNAERPSTADRVQVEFARQGPPRITPVKTLPAIPNPREREQKLRLQMPAAVQAVVSGITETEDFIDVLFDNLPASEKRKLKKNQRTFQGKVALLFQNLDRLATWEYWDKAIVDLVLDQLEDVAFGGVGNASKALGKRQGWSRGPQPSRLPGNWPLPRKGR